MVASAALLAAAAAWLVFPGAGAPARRAFGSPLAGGTGFVPPANRLQASPSPLPGVSRRAGPPWRRAGPNEELEQHIRAVRQLASLLRSGRSPGEAWTLLERAWRDGPAGSGAEDIAAACRAALTAHGMGLPTSTGLTRHVRGSLGASAAAWERVVWSLRLAEGVGAAPAELLDRVADQLEATEDRRRSLEAVMAGPRATQRLLSWLPLFGLGLAQLMGAEPLVVFTTHLLGPPCLSAGLALWWLNRVWARKLVQAAERDSP